MRCSIAFIAAAIAVTVLASHESNYKVMARYDLLFDSTVVALRRKLCTPSQFPDFLQLTAYALGSFSKMKDETDMKCFGGGPGCGGQMSFVANQGFQQVSTIVTVQNIQQVGTFPAIPSIPPIAQQGWAGCGQGFSFFASSLSAFALAFQQTQIAQAQLVQSFFNISRLFSLIIQQIQGFAQWGSVDPFMSQIGPIYGHIFQLIQGLLAAINSVCGLPTFIALVGRIRPKPHVLRHLRPAVRTHAEQLFKQPNSRSPKPNRSPSVHSAASLALPPSTLVSPLRAAVSRAPLPPAPLPRSHSPTPTIVSAVPAAFKVKAKVLSLPPPRILQPPTLCRLATFQIL
ncbi:hypothetical protein CROQUDRAFT_85478 [Cronartium quercuum f. sp. fusiforme G11]|uniref:Uncharacterized protein n=1 Tax=Cronartium quercuum f. sp. fusiforme G11 TaxID=708437 RepID=A0A9P6NVI9_9BASI|nr:hypothetical protein CROQUDRAFT_85478 [Cronartium quercuum f. sp. fusiforme G11]